MNINYIVIILLLGSEKNIFVDEDEQLKKHNTWSKVGLKYVIFSNGYY